MSTVAHTKKRERFLTRRAVESEPVLEPSLPFADGADALKFFESQLRNIYAFTDGKDVAE